MVAENRFRTVVDIPFQGRKLGLHDNSVFLGSCFAENVGQRFVDYGLKATVNPVGVLYNPQSIYNVVHQALEPQELPLFEAGGEWRCWLTGTLLGGRTEEECRNIVDGAFLLLGDALRQSQRLFITLGTNVTYQLQSNLLTVSNCQKQPGKLFREVEMDAILCSKVLQMLVRLVLQYNPMIQITFTVSPYRYAKYGFHRNQLAKAKLLLAVEEACQKFPQQVNYFPAYEIVLDELRDYRFYNQDMLHPSPVAVDYIWERLRDNLLDSETLNFLREYDPIRKDLAHKPFNPDSPQALAFKARTESRLDELKRKYNL